VSPERAAEVLGVDVGALPHEITGAFAARARRTHPDVDGGSADAFREAVEARNVLLGWGGGRAGRAGGSSGSGGPGAGGPGGSGGGGSDPGGSGESRGTERGARRPAAAEPDGYIVFDEDPDARPNSGVGASAGGTERADEFPPWVVVPRAPSPALIAVGGGLMLLGAFLSVYDVPLPWTAAEPIARWAVLIAAAIAFAVTGRRPFLAVMVVAVVVTLVVNVAFTTIGGLLGLFVLMPAIVAINAAGFARRRRRTAGL
jgi:hypothetical protein